MIPREFSTHTLSMLVPQCLLFTHEGILVIFFLNKEKPEFQMANKMIFSFIVTYQQKNYSL